MIGLAAAAGCLAALVSGAAAQALGPEFSHSKVRLLEGEFGNDAWSAGIEIELADGWKTYWRMPGESGVPPEFDWSGSSNLQAVELRWPAPRRYHDDAGETIGYAGRVVFPLTVRPVDGAKPVELSLGLRYAVCKDICIPARAEVREVLADDGISPAGVSVIERFEALVPTPEASGLDITNVTLAETEDGPRLSVALSGPAVDDATDIFVEGFDHAYFRAPRPAGVDGEAKLFELPIDGLDDAAMLKGRKLTLTVVTGRARLVREATVQ
jgi:DsbC/DsbD-like thiol-disulfide interchange protein